MILDGVSKSSSTKTSSFGLFSKSPDLSGNSFDHREESKCYGCGVAIRDLYVLMAGDRRWHSSMDCLRCFDCGSALQNGSKCFVNKDKIFCSQDYKRLFCQKKCKRCDVVISGDELVMRTVQNDIYHVTCFVCVVCLVRLTSGQQYGLKEGKIYCKFHFESLISSGQFETTPFCFDSKPSMPSSVHPANYFNSPPSLESSANQSLQEFDQPSNQNSAYTSIENSKCRPRRKKLTPDDDDGGPEFTSTDSFDQQFIFHLEDNNPGEFNDLHSHLTTEEFQYLKEHNKTIQGAFINNNNNNSSNNNNRQKRLRTSFKHHQLRTMKSYFSMNHNPDAKDLKELAQKTGLTKRVLQVWFQNARAKFRRNVMKQDTNRTDEGLTSLNESQGQERPASSTEASSSPLCAGSKHSLKNLMSPSLSDVSTSSFCQPFDEDSSSAITDMTTNFIDS